MQAANIYLPPTPAKVETKLAEPTKNNSSKQGFDQVLKTTQEKESQDTSKAAQNKPDNSQNQAKDNQPQETVQNNSEAKVKEPQEAKQEVRDPQDVVELSQFGLPVLLNVLSTTNAENVQESNAVFVLQNSNSLINSPMNAQQIPLASSAEAAQSNKLVTPDFAQLVQSNVIPQVISSEESNVGQLASGENKQSIISDATLNSEMTATVSPENKILTSKSENSEQNSPLVAFLDRGKENSEKSDNQSSSPSDKVKDFWQALSGKVEVKEISSILANNPGNNQESSENNKQDNSFTSVLQPLTTNSTQETAQGKEPNFAKSLDSLQKDILQQVVQKIQVSLKPGQSEMHMHLKPEHLGEVQMKLVMEDGKVNAQFLTNNQAAKEALESNLAQLKQNLQDQGIKVEKLSVLIGGGNLQFNQGRKEEAFTNPQKIAKNWRKISSDSYEVADISSVENERTQILSSDQVDYKA